ncbi:hypothetical protein GEMMAAP_19240 [Gemmatimonas phototrophica]|uniref:IcmF-related N-terminal domain-containing protein n=1 Tax=Gemmatimonas phototrophica TaxID=1379270 RepID=A0A143BPA2_9BACT|nr:hypothetical protein GEMMAAP_19240 [Gemmatimonas phototrophica]
MPPSTKTANVWAMQHGVIAELSSKLLTDAPRFAKVVRALRAPRVAAAVGKGEAAARAVVVCVPCDLFYAGANGEQLQTLAQAMRLRLAEAAKELGLAVPVYVMFTKMDRVPYFEAWASVFTKDELRAPLGATLAFDTQADTGNYAERLAPRLTQAFSEISETLGARRVEVLGRETQLDRRYSAYELPREFRKVQAAVSQFLVELCRPTQLGASPQLRGFYFTGARPVVVTDVGAAPAAAAQAVTSDATGLFRQAAMPSAPVASAAVSRKVPEWVFLDRFLRDVVLADTGAASVARGGVRVQRARRVMFGSGIAASVLALIMVTVSWLGNRALQSRVQEAAQAVSALPTVQSAPGTVAFPSVEALSRLDALRSQLDTLGAYEREGPPLRLRFGLWRGAALLDAARPVWFDGFRKQLFTDAWTAMSDSLKSLPDVPSASNDYGESYGWLKAYLITTTSPDSSTSAFLAPVLLSSWQRGMTTDADVTALARRQFEYYASALPTVNPYPRAADAAVVSHARDFLSRFTGAEQIYLNMLGAANAAVPPVKIPQSPGILMATAEVQGAFSSKGAAFMSDAFRNADRYFQGETWVVGDVTAAKSLNRDSVVASLRARYRDDYGRTWTQVVQSAKVINGSTVKDAATKLDVLAGVQSPLLQVLRTVAMNTAVDSTMRMDFQPVHAVTPPEITDKFVSEKNQPYMDGLLGLQGVLLQVANMPPAVDTPSTQALVQAAQLAAGDVTKARVAAKRVSQSFDVSGAGGALATPVEQLLLAPITGAEAVLKTVASQRPPAKRLPAPPVAAPVAAGGGGGGGAAAGTAAEAAILNERGRALCSRVDQLTSRFPFNPEATSDASVADIKAILAPGNGELWVFQQERLAPYLEKQGNAWVAKGGGKVELSKSFVDFFNRAADVSNALFAEDPATPMVRWLASGVITDNTPLLILRNNGKEARFDKRSFKNEVVWPATNGRDAELQAQFKKNKPIKVRSAVGDWAIFRLVANADQFEGQNVTWNATGKDAQPVMLKFEALRREAANVLTRGWMGRMSCVSQVTK